jgi:opacity protein-like surface antigen
VFSDLTLKTKGRVNGTSTQISTNSQNGTVNYTDSNSYKFSDTATFFDQLQSLPAVVGRIGVLAGPNFLFYGIGGVAFGNFVYGNGWNEDWATGYTIGGGGEFRVTGAWSLRGEYRFYHFDYDRSRTGGGPNSSTRKTYDASGNLNYVDTNTGNSNFTQHYDTDVDLSMGKVAVVYRFCGLLGQC